MKIPSIIIAAFILLGLNVNAQEKTAKLPVDPETNLITYKDVVTDPGTPAELYNRAIEWINKEYKNPVDATKVRDQASGVIEIIHRMEITRNDQGSTLIAGRVDYSMKLEMKEGRYRYTITSFIWRDKSRQPLEQYLDKQSQMYTPAWDGYLKQVDDFTRKLIESLKKGMQAPAAKKPDTW